MTGDQFTVQDTISRFGRLVDDQDWPGLPKMFTERVKLDYTRLFGGTPEEVPGSTIGDRWRKRLGGFDATQHVITNIVADIEGDDASVVANVVAHHVLTALGDDGMLTGGGTYHIRLTRTGDRWLIAEIGVRVFWLDGNKNLFAAAAENARV
jgi:hypothetical protein